MSDKDFHIQSSVDILMLTYDEKWPEESYKNRFGESLVNKAKNLNTSRWAVLDDISNWPVKTPEEIDNCCDLSATLADMGFQHCAVVGHKYALSKWMMKKVIPDKVEVAFFDSINQSKTWLSSLGYNVNFT
jgi:hypothetical protein